MDLITPANNPPGEWELIDGEEYTVTLTLTDTHSRLRKAAVYDPDGNLLDEQMADPPVASLTAQGAFVAAQNRKQDYRFEFKHDFDCNWEAVLVKEWDGEEPPPLPVVIQVWVVDGNEAPPVALAGQSVTVWEAGEPEESGVEQTTGVEGEPATFHVSEGDWMIKIVTTGEQCKFMKGPISLLPQDHPYKEVFPVYDHLGINGKIWFETPEGEPADGDPGNVVVELFEGQDKIMDGMVSETKQPEGWYRYVIGPRPVTGSYTVKARYDPPEGEEQVDDGPVSVPNDCGAVVADPRNIVTEIDPGAHQVTWGPEFTFTVQPEGPMW